MKISATLVTVPLVALLAGTLAGCGHRAPPVAPTVLVPGSHSAPTAPASASVAARTGRAGEFTVTVLRTNRFSRLPASLDSVGEATPEPGNVFFVVYVKVTNNGNRPQMACGDTTVMDGQGREYEQSTKSYSLCGTTGDSGNPGTAQRLTVAFEIPQPAKPVTLHVPGDGYRDGTVISPATGEPVQLDVS